MIGSTVSHYRILEKLGEGGMGVVYKAQDLKLDRLVALKFLPPHLARDEQDKQRFIHEAKAASALDNPNVGTIYEISETDDGQMFMAMAYYEGETLKEKIARARLPLNEIIDIALQVASGLAKAHTRHITHRDIKPGNIIVTREGVAKIVDFGLAKLAGRTKVTRTGATMGTIAYMSPEQAQGNEVDQRSDIWSLGVTLHEMLTGELPFKSEYEQAIVYAILNERPRPVSSSRNDIPAELDGIVARCLEKEPSKRYEDVNELLAELHKLKGAPISLGLAWNLARWKLRSYGVTAAAVAVILSGIGYFLFDPFGRTAEASRQSLAVVYFENLPDPEDKDRTGAMLANLLTTSLSQVKEIDVTSREKLYHIQRYLTQSDEKAITPSLATQIAQQAGVRWLLSGTILQKQPNLLVTTSLVDVKSGRVVSSYKTPEMSPDKLFTLADSLALSVMTALGVAPTTIAETRPSWQLVTTKSQEAYRAYIEGHEALRKFRWNDAQAPLKRAVELDSSFATAHLFLSTALWLSGDRRGTRTAAERAMALRHLVTDLERMRIEAYYAGVIEKDWPKSIHINEQYMLRYPNDPDPYLVLAHQYADLGQYEKSEKVYLQWVKLDPFDKAAWNSLAHLYAGLGRKKEALQAIDQYLKLAPGEFNPYDSKADIYLAFGELDSARYWGEKTVAFWPPRAAMLASDALLRQDYSAAERYYHQSGSTTQLFRIAIHRGRLFEAEQQMQKLKPHPLQWLVWTSYERGNYPAMLKHAQEWSDILKKDLTDKVYGRDLLAWALLKNGNSKGAYEVLKEVRKDLGVIKDPYQQSQYEYALGLLSFEEEKYDLAVKHIQAAFEIAYPNRAGQFHYGVALLKAGRLAEAITELLRSSRRLMLGSYPKMYLNFLPTRNYWLLGIVKSHYWLGVAYEQQGDKQRAIKEYQTFLNIWKDADFASPELKDARARLAKLRQG